MNAGAAAVCRLAGCEGEWRRLYALMARALSPGRLAHSLAVADTAVDLGRVFGGDPVALALAGLLHDGAKELGKAGLLALGEAHGLLCDPAERESPGLLHGPAAAWLAAAEWGVSNPEILEAIRLHTTGDAAMSLSAAIVFMADLIEPGRDYSGVDLLRRLSGQDLRAAMIEALEQTLEYVKHKKQPLHSGTERCLEWLRHEGGRAWKAKNWPSWPPGPWSKEKAPKSPS